MSTEGGHSPALRRERTRRAVGRLGERIAAWVSTWSKADGVHSQIERLGATLGAMTAQLRARADRLPDGTAAFALCRGVDNDLAVVERLWERFADAFGQRKDPVRGPLLQAADELVWSCVAMAQPLAASKLPLPLAYVEPAYSTSATPRVKPPPTAPVADRKLEAALGELPVPLIGLPSTIVDEPWWLSLLAHEVGHHVQYDLEADGALIGKTAAVLVAAGGGAADPDAAARWGGWKYEAFADAFSVAALGPRALDVIAALEWDDGPAMIATRTPLYPPVVVRLALMAEVAAALGFEPPFRAAGWAEARADAATAALLDRTPAAARALVDAPLGTGSLRTLAGAAAPGADPIAAAMGKVLAGAAIGLKGGPAEPRRAIAAAFGAWQALADAAADARARATAALVPRTLALVVEVRDPTVVKRAAIAEAAPDPVAARALAAMAAVEAEPGGPP